MLFRTVPVAVVGAGPAGLFAAETLARAGVGALVLDRMPSVGRKFQLAGRGGLNLTHSEPLDRFTARYGAAEDVLRPMIEAFGPADLAAWADSLGEPTFVGTSGRVFPKSFKTSPLLRAWLGRLDGLGVTVMTRRRFVGFDGEGRLVIEGPDGEERIAAQATILALGGASWPRMGSDGAWTSILARQGVAVAPLAPANMGVSIAWSPGFADCFAGSALKRIAVVTAGGVRAEGEAVISRGGLEGGAVYAVAADLRDALARNDHAEIALDLKPDLPQSELERRLGRMRAKDSRANALRKATGLSPAAIGLLTEAGGTGRDAERLSALVKRLPLRVIGTGSLERAISSAGGVRFESVDADLMLNAMPGVFVAGEMLDWEAPTGGYLLQATFSTARRAAAGAARFIARSAFADRE